MDISDFALKIVFTNQSKLTFILRKGITSLRVCARNSLIIPYLYFCLKHFFSGSVSFFWFLPHLWCSCSCLSWNIRLSILLPTVKSCLKILGWNGTCQTNVADQNGLHLRGLKVDDKMSNSAVVAQILSDIVIKLLVILFASIHRIFQPQIFLLMLGYTEAHNSIGSE